MSEQIILKLKDLYQKTFNQEVQKVYAFPHTASGRRYFRLSHDEHTVIGVYGDNTAENKAFLSFSQHFKDKGINVPTIIAQEENTYYLQEDLGDESLMSWNQKLRKGQEAFPSALQLLYQKSISQLCKMQIEAAKGLDYSYVLGRERFDVTAIQWDLNYFKYYFLNMNDIHYDENTLQEDFNTLSSYLASIKSDFFMFRDFQSRNIMIVNDEPYFIDYQGGRKGALAYDLASLLYQAKANIPQSLRDELLDYYINEAQKYIPINEQGFKNEFYAFLLIRFLQTLGAYGRRGLIEKMTYFIQSIPLALKNIEWWLQNVDLDLNIDYLKSILHKMCQNEKLKTFDKNKGAASPLVVKVRSFSYKEGIPQDDSGNGGGYVFDCRSIHNPGRYAPYKKQTGRDQAVKDFLLAESHIQAFLQEVYHLVDASVENYIERNFESLMVSFGCTGGQHRSVFCADALTRHLQEKFGVNVQLKHIVQERKNWVN